MREKALQEGHNGIGIAGNLYDRTFSFASLNKMKQRAQTLFVMLIALFFASTVLDVPITPISSAIAKKKRTKKTTSKKEKEKPLTPEQQIKRLVDRAKVEQADKKIAAYLNRKPDSVFVLYQKARLALIRNGTEPADNILGWQYPKKGKSQAMPILNKVLKLDPQYGPAHSLAGIVHTLTGEPSKAQASFKRAQAAPVRAVWLPRNRAVLAALQGDYIESARLIRPMIEQWPRKYAPEYRRAYPSYWQLMQKLIAREPKLEVVPVIREGLVTRIQYKDFKTFLNNRPVSERPLLVLFGSSDTACHPCTQGMIALDTIARRHSNELEIALVSFEPWLSQMRRARKENLIDRLHGLPTWRLYYKNREPDQGLDAASTGGTDSDTPAPDYEPVKTSRLFFTTVESAIHQIRCLNSESAQPSSRKQCNALPDPGVLDRSAQMKADLQFGNDRKLPEAIDKIRKFRKKAKHNSAGRELKKHEKQWPDSISLSLEGVYQDLQTKLIPADNIVGVKLSDADDRKTLASINSIIERSPEWPSVSSMLAAVHAMQGRYDKSRALIEQYEGAIRKHQWITVAKAIILAKDKQYQQAMDRLRPLLLRRPIATDGFTAAYRIAWSIARGIGITKPELDPSELVRDKVVRRVRVSDLPTTLAKMKNNKKPVFVIAGSMDRWCGYCIFNTAAMAHFTRQHADKFTFLYASVEPYQDILNVVVHDRKSKAAPWHAIAHKGQVQYIKPGQIKAEHIAAILEAYPGIIDGTHASKRQEQGRAKIWPRVEKTLATYMKAKGAKAAAVALEDHRVVMGRSINQFSWAIAASRAMERCNWRRTKQALTEPCKLIAIGSQRVDDWPGEKIDGLISTIDEPTSFDLYFQKYERIKNQKAMAIAFNKSGTAYQANYATSASSMSDARQSALARCNKNARKRKTKFPDCQVYFEGNDGVKPLPTYK